LIVLVETLRRQGYQARKYNWSSPVKHVLPPNHGLSDAVLTNVALLPRDDAGDPSLTDVQFDALSAGVACGHSMLCVSPTSTGKTLIGVWSVLTWLEGRHDRRAVYLVTHRALARQKFEDMLALLCDSLFAGDPSCIVLATGDLVQDGAGAVPIAPLDAPLLVATYEKYLGMVAASGVRGDMTHCTVVCDEIQILGDETRGRSVEVLLTLLRRAGWGQLIGLSAVLDPVDASALANWLDVALVTSAVREKHLIYECRSASFVYTFDTGQPSLGVQTRARGIADAIAIADIVRELIALPRNRPVVVFCMTVARVYELAAELAGLRNVSLALTQPLLPGFDEDTSAARELSLFMTKKVAFHTAALRDGERRLVEEAIAERRVNVVVATSTLAAGVNFPLGAVVFDKWVRYDSKRKIHLALPESEFQNMAGRAGRMGMGSEVGRVVFVADGNAFQQRPAMVYLQPDRVSRLEPRLDAKAFEQVALQLLSAGLCGTEGEVYDFLLSTFSAHRELNTNRAGLDHWRRSVSDAVTALREWGYIL
jgi:helicase